ncbi:hypothetical protein M514_04449 [Trichuris suis]|uniref:Potassium channel domain-containing protein n=1 Tax=Trichuris suis TaxID=68888 RepID=A0A085MZ29_9BILA|nr:hypothetical protein M514_04449 [Trichuris suis]
MGRPIVHSMMASQKCRYKTAESTSFPESLSTFSAALSSEGLSLYLNNEQDRPEETEACGDHLIPNNYRSIPINDTYKSQVPSLFSDSDSKNWRKVSSSTFHVAHNIMMLKELYIILPHFGLVFLSLMYTVIGAGVFYYIEYPNESILKRKSLDRISQLHGVFTDDLWQLFRNQSISSKGHWDQLVDDYFDQLMETMHEAFSDNYISVDEIRNNRTENVWTFSSSFFFSITLITTIGYGHLVPKTLDGRVACLIFAVFGIPLILVTIADLGKFLSLLTGKTYVALSGSCKTICKRTCILFPLCAKRSSCEGSARGHESTSVSETYAGNMSENEFLNPDEKTVSVFFVMAIWIGYTALGALLLQLWEPWTFFDSFYYCFITVTTIDGLPYHVAKMHLLSFRFWRHCAIKQGISLGNSSVFRSRLGSDHDVR